MSKGTKKVRSRSQITIRFWVVLALATTAGGFIGFFSNWYEKSAYELLMEVRDWSMLYSTYILIVVEVLMFAGSFYYYFRARRLMSEWNQEDEAAFDKIDKTQGIALMITSVGVILNMVVFGLVMADMGQKDKHISMDMVGALIFVVSIIAITFVQRLIIDETKKLRPEKQGDALDFSFQKTWIDSCDEQERQQIYRASYKAYSTGNVMYPVLLVVLMVGQLTFRLGFAPILVLGIIWMVQTVAYQIEALKNH